MGRCQRQYYHLFIYCIWTCLFSLGIRRAIRNKPHKHIHFHKDGEPHQHEHTHTEEHINVHEEKENKTNLTPWILFTIYIFGPCEPLIPLVMYPAAKNNYGELIMVTSIFSAITILTMVTLVLITSF